MATATLFVADGLRPGSVNAKDAPTLDALREQGVSFLNSHSLYPTFTTPNASAIATGHYLGDTGDFANARALHRLEEALQGNAAPAVPLERCLAVSRPASDGRRTALQFQRYAGRLYLDQAALRVVLQQERTGCSRH
jgi:arylsulfatase A-like enzyme